MEIFAAVTGVIFLILEIRQSNWMWAVEILTGITSMAVFFGESLYANMALNFYYVAVAVWGYVSWRRDAAGVPVAEPDAGGGDIHLRRLGLQTVCVSALVWVAGTCALTLILRYLDDPSTLLDAGTTVLCLVATWWLVKTYKEQWLLWIAADMLTAWMCLSQGLLWMTGLYAFYSLSAIYGYVHWAQTGRYVG